MSHYLSRSYANLPNYTGDMYALNNYSFWQNYTVPFGLPTGYFYSPHSYAPRNEFTQSPNVVCNKTRDHRYCPDVTKIVHGHHHLPSMCQLNDNRLITSARTLAECQSVSSWPAEILQDQ